ncbi:MAG: hypothetical protein ACTS5I_16565 [Rhodanobacter sp.]
MNSLAAAARSSFAACLPKRIRRDLCRYGVMLVLLLVAGTAWSFWPAPTEPAINQLVRWQDAGHNWLLVVDSQTRELVVYDADDGRPLERLGADDGLPKVRSIIRQGSLLYVTGDPHAEVQLLKLPQLQAVARTR